MCSLSVIILTFNEQRHIERAIRSVAEVAERVFVVDSGSTDQTCELANSLGAVVLKHPWVNHATQVNWALDNCPIDTRWVFRLDADEWVSPALAAELRQALPTVAQDVAAITVPRRMYFMGRWMAHGGVGERQILRLFRVGQARCEQRWMDEHMLVGGGRVIAFKHPLIDENLQSLSWWIDKHNGYASREAVEVLLATRNGAAAVASHGVRGQVRRIRWLKRQYYRFPPVIRALLVFVIRYFVLLGVLDGKAGLIFHFLQGCWYRALVDAKVYAVQQTMHKEGLDFDDAVRAQLQIDLSANAGSAAAQKVGVS